MTGEAKPQPGELWIGCTDDMQEVVINFPPMRTDPDGYGWISFTAKEARALAQLLIQHAGKVDLAAALTSERKQ